MKNKLNKILAVILAIHLVIGGISPALVAYAEAPEAPEAPEVEETEEVEEVLVDVEDNSSKDPVVTPTQESIVNTESDLNPTTGSDSNGNVGDTSITTGDGSSNGNILTDANTNVASNDGECCGGGSSVTNDGNGANSDNDGSATVVNNNTTDQNNSANIDNGLTGTTITGANSASNNVGDSYINTGNANATGTIITAANTNVDGLAISEFNIVDDHFGDFILDFGASCVSGCDGFTNSVLNSNNGANSDNTGNLNTTTNNTTDQTNTGTVNNTLDLISNSGNNTASGNTGGDSFITTGDASVAGNVLTFLNNNLAGNVIFGVVNIFGELIGDIILPESALNSFACTTCGDDTTLVNSNNGANSDNNGQIGQTVNNTYNQMNVADINNNLILDAGTGGNKASGNTGGDAYVTTGDASVMAQVLNIANTNLINGDMWLVIINRAGKWIGQIVGAPTGSLFAGSEGTEFEVDENGQITVANTGNGSGSTNNGSVDSTTNNTTNQTNVATVNNNLNLSANTGKNSTSNNTGGDNYITTGDAEVIANLVNFVNNNIVGGRLLVTFVNVFGDWTGNFITPGQQKLNTEELAQGGIEEETNYSNANFQGNAGGASSSSQGGSNNLVSAAGTFGGGSNNQGGTNTTSQGGGSMTSGVTVAGINSVSNALQGLTKGTSTKEKTRINLAWAILLTPLFALMILTRKIYTRIKPSLPAGKAA